MDKYTYNIKADKIQKLVKRGDYATAVKIADTVDWEEVHSGRMLTITAAAYEHTRDFKTAIELLEMAYEESPVGKRILYKLTGLAIADGNEALAQRYYEMFLQEAPDDNGRYLLRYLLAELRGEDLDKRIAILETYRKYEFDEQWAMRLAELYDEAGYGDACVKLCDEIILWFGVGANAEEAMRLKEKYAPLSKSQIERRENREFYEQRYRDVVSEYTKQNAPAPEAEAAENAEGEGRVAERVEESAASQAPASEPPALIWSDRFRYVEAAELQGAVSGALRKLSELHEKRGEAMNKLTSITARKMNMMGVVSALVRIGDKDLLITESSSLKDEVLEDFIRVAKEDPAGSIFVFADTAGQLAYLDDRINRLEAKLSADDLPSIDLSGEEDIVIHLEGLPEENFNFDMDAPTKVLENLEHKDSDEVLPAGDGATMVVPVSRIRP